MLKNYLLLALRVIRRNKLYSLINIGCLAIGIAVTMTVMVYVLHEHSYDGWHANAKRIFAVDGTLKFGDGIMSTDLMNYSAGPLIARADPQVEQYLRVLPAFQPVNMQEPRKPDQFFTEKDNFIYADSNFFQFFSYRLLRGNPGSVLSRPYTVVITERMARKYFGGSDPIGRTLRADGQYAFEVTGVAADPPSNTDLSFDFVASMASVSTVKNYSDFIRQEKAIQYGTFNTWLLLKDPRGVNGVARNINRMANSSGLTLNEPGVYKLQRWTDHHLDNVFGNGLNSRYLQVFPLVAGLILLLALVNYMSLATARAAVRAKEVGVRKVIGAGRAALAAQFYTESAVFALLSFAGGILLFLLWRPFFFRMLDLKIDNTFLSSPQVLLSATALLLLMILSAGSYPSIVLSAFRPIEVLYGRLSRRRAGERVRKGFTVFQFTMAMSLVLCSVIIEKELHYIRHSDTGVDRDNVVMIPFSDHFGHYPAFRHEVEAVPGIRQVATSHYGIFKGSDGLSLTGPGSSREVQVAGLSADDRFIPMLGLKWKEKPARELDLYAAHHVLLNETAVLKLGLSGDPVGQRVKFGADELIVAGILKDFNFEGLRAKIGPLMLSLSKDTASVWGKGEQGCLLAKIQAHANIPTIVEAIKKIYGRYDRQTAFEYSFADDAFDAQYKAEDRLAGMFGLFTGITIVIACLGLFALATFSAQQRVKEIGIRKVLGASVASIGALLSRDFLRPVALAVLIACPVSWWVMNKWLDDFAYRTALSWWIFAVAGAGLLLVALGTVLSRSLRAGRANPVENLRME